MMKFLLTGAVALMTPGGAVAQQAPAPAKATADADPALWVVKDDDTTIYLFGTVHVLKPGLSWFDEAVKKAFDSSDDLVLEIKQPDAQAMQGLMMRLGIDPAAAPLSERLPNGKGDAYLKMMADIGLPQAVADRFKPWLAATILSVAPLQALGYDPANGPETVLTAAATDGGKALGELETAEAQLRMLDGLSKEAQMAFLTSVIDDHEKLGPMMAEMVGEWADGDPDALAVLMNESLKDTPELAKVLLADRNARWAEWIDARMDKPGTVFVAVGAGHLAGKDSVQAKLTGHDLTARRIAY